MVRKLFAAVVAVAVCAFAFGSNDAKAEVIVLVGAASNPTGAPAEVEVPLGSLSLPGGTTVVSVDISAVAGLADGTLGSISASPVMGESKLIHVVIDGSSIGAVGDPIASMGFFDFAGLSGMVSSGLGTHSDLDVVLKTVLGPHDTISVFGIATVEVIPEPASLALLGLGVVTMLRKRNRAVTA